MRSATSGQTVVPTLEDRRKVMEELRRALESRRLAALAAENGGFVLAKDLPVGACFYAPCTDVVYEVVEVQADGWVRMKFDDFDRPGLRAMPAGLNGLTAKVAISVQSFSADDEHMIGIIVSKPTVETLAPLMLSDGRWEWDR